MAHRASRGMLTESTHINIVYHVQTKYTCSKVVKEFVYIPIIRLYSEVDVSLAFVKKYAFL
jgi:hypothetical protein